MDTHTTMRMLDRPPDTQGSIALHSPSRQPTALPATGAPSRQTRARVSFESGAETARGHQAPRVLFVEREAMNVRPSARAERSHRAFQTQLCVERAQLAREDHFERERARRRELERLPASDAQLAREDHFESKRAQQRELTELKQLPEEHSTSAEIVPFPRKVPTPLPPKTTEHMGMDDKDDVEVAFPSPQKSARSWDDAHSRAAFIEKLSHGHRKRMTMTRDLIVLECLAKQSSTVAAPLPKDSPAKDPLLGVPGGVVVDVLPPSYRLPPDSNPRREFQTRGKGGGGGGGGGGGSGAHPTAAFAAYAVARDSAARVVAAYGSPNWRTSPPCTDPTSPRGMNPPKVPGATHARAPRWQKPAVWRAAQPALPNQTTKPYSPRKAQNVKFAAASSPSTERQVVGKAESVAMMSGSHVQEELEMLEWRSVKWPGDRSPQPRQLTPPPTVHDASLHTALRSGMRSRPQHVAEPILMDDMPDIDPLTKRLRPPGYGKKAGISQCACASMHAREHSRSAHRRLHSSIALCPPSLLGGDRRLTFSRCLPLVITALEINSEAQQKAKRRSKQAGREQTRAAFQEARAWARGAQDLMPSESPHHEHPMHRSAERTRDSPAHRQAKHEMQHLHVKGPSLKLRAAAAARVQAPEHGDEAISVRRANVGVSYAARIDL